MNLKLFRCKENRFQSNIPGKCKRVDYERGETLRKYEKALHKRDENPPPPPRKPLLEDVLFVLTSELCSLNFAVVGFYAGVQTTLVGQSEPGSDKHHGEVYDMDCRTRK